MGELSPAFAEQLRQLQEAFLRDVPARLEAIRRPWDETTEPLPQRIQRMHEVAHQLAGAAGTFGFEELGRAARALDDHLKTRLGLDSAPDPDPIAGLLEILRNANPGSR